MSIFEEGKSEMHSKFKFMSEELDHISEHLE